MKVTTDSCLFGAWCAAKMAGQEKRTGLDVGTGSGLLSLMVAQKTSHHLDAIELDGGAAAQAEANIADSPFADRISVVTGDILSWPVDRRYDFIVSNPPFYEKDLKSGRHKANLAHHSEALPLRSLLANVKGRLELTGSLYLLLPARRHRELAALFGQTGWFLRDMVTVSQTVRHPPFRILLQLSLSAGDCSNSSMVIKDEHDQYTPAFINLLRDYYLHL